MGSCASQVAPVPKADIKSSVPFTKSSRIAVVGGGAGGLDMASQLIKRGYTNITVFEKEARVGGKARTVTVEGEHYDTGTVLTYNDPVLVELLEEVGLYQHMIPIDHMHTLVYSGHSEQLLDKLALTKKLTGINFLLQLKISMDHQLEKFSRLYHVMVDKHGYPKREYSWELQKPIYQFLDLHGLDLLKPLIEVRLQSQGYDRGQLLTFYALFFIDPQFLIADAEMSQFTVGHGWQDVWEALVKVQDIKVEYNSKVETVEMIDDETIAVTVYDMVSKTTSAQTFDFCVFDVPDPLKLITRPTFFQKMYLSKFNNHSPVYTSIYKMTNNNNFRYEIIFDRDSKFIDQDHLGLALYRKNDAAGVQVDKSTAVVVAYSYLKNNCRITEDHVEGVHYMESHVKEHIQFITKEEIIEKVEGVINNDYIPHCSADSVRVHVPWHIFDLQGENKMWFTGAFASFDLTMSIMNYNRKLLERYDFN